MTYSTVTLTGTYLGFDGAPASGTVTIIPTVPQIIDAVGNVILSGNVRATLNSAGSFSVVLPATDDVRLNPTGFGYTLIPGLTNGQLAAVSFALPAAVPTVDVADITPVSASTFTAAATYVTLSSLVLNVRDYGAKGDGTTDDTAAIQAAITAVSANGGKVLIPGGTGTTYRCDSTIVVKRRVEVEVAAGTIVRRVTAATSTDPVFRLDGIEAALVGRGRVETEKVSPNGVVLIGPAAITDPIINVLSVRIEGVVIAGVKATGNVGLKLWSTFIANGGATYQNLIRDVTIDGFGTGVLASDVANANEFHGVMLKNILDYCYDFNANTASRGADENAVIGGFVHASSGVTVVRMQNTIYNVIVGLRTEPGGTSVPFNLDATSQENYVHIQHNNAGVGVDSGIRNTTQGRKAFNGARIVGTDGLLTMTKAGAIVDGDFSTTAAAGLMGVDTTNHRLYVRESAWRHAKLRTRSLTLATVKDFGSIAAGATAELTATVTGAVSGDVVIVTPTGAPEAGLIWTGYVSAADTVTIRLANVTTGAIDPASRTWNIEVQSAS